MSLNILFLCSKLKNGLLKIVNKSQAVNKFNVTKSRLHCTYLLDCYLKCIHKKPLILVMNERFLKIDYLVKLLIWDFFLTLRFKPFYL